LDLSVNEKKEMLKLGKVERGKNIVEERENLMIVNKNNI
jgi:hypothetical protein